MTSLLAFIRLGRPHFLFGGFVVYGLGAVVAKVGAGTGAGGARFDVGPYLLGQAAITAVQLMTHYANDYFDLAADLANSTPTRWSGGSRVLPSGVLPARTALVAAAVLAALGVALAIVLAMHGGQGGPAAAAVVILAQLLAWFYSAPPLALHSRGWGEATTALVVTILTPLCGFLVQAGGFRAGLALLPTLALALIPLAGLQFVMLLAIEFPDAAGDALTGKRTLVVRLGARWAAALFRATLIAIYGALPLLALWGLPLVAVAGAALAFPIAVWQFSRLGGGAWGDPDRWESLAFWAVASLMITSAGELIAFIWLSLKR